MASSTPTSLITTTSSTTSITSSTIVSSVPAAVSIGSVPVNQRRFSSAARLFTTESNSSPSSSAVSNSQSKLLDLSNLESSTDVSSIAESSSLLDSTHLSPSSLPSVTDTSLCTSSSPCLSRTSDLINSYSNFSFLSPVSSSPSSFSCANTTTTISNGSTDPLSQLVINLLAPQPKTSTENEANPSLEPTEVLTSSNRSLVTENSNVSSSPPISSPVSSSDAQEISYSCPVSSLPSSSLEASSSSLNSTIILSELPSPKFPHVPANSTSTIVSSQSPLQASLIKQTNTSPKESPPTSSPVSLPSSNAAVQSDDFPPVASVNAHNATSIPVALQHVLTYLISKTDSLSAQCEELKSKNEIMQNSIISTIGNNLNHKFSSLRKELLTSFENLGGEATIRQCTEICNKMEEDLTKRLGDVIKDNDEMRKVWDTHMGRIRQRIHSVVDDDEEDDGSASDEGEGRSAHLSSTDIKLNRLKAEIKSLQNENYKLDVRLVEVEQYSRRESLVFTGIPANIPQKDLELKVLEIMYHLGYQGSTQLTHDDISACHRLWQPPSSRNPARVIVKFTNRKVVEWTLAHKSNLAQVREQLGLNLEVSESICAKNTESLKICKQLLDDGQIIKYYTRNGFPKVIVGEYDAPVKINHPNVLRERFDVNPIR